MNRQWFAGVGVARVQSVLSLALREGTLELHRQLEHSAFMQTLLRGQMDRARYCALLRNLHAIYAALEDALRRQGAHPWLAVARCAGLSRTSALALDLAMLHGDLWRSDLELQPAARNYVRHVQHLEHAAPGRLLAHAYVRYLGDLSGGQILRRIVRASLALDGPGGTAFYSFGSPEQAAALARQFRHGLDALDLDASGVDVLVDEAAEAFALHGPLFEQLMAAPQASGGAGMPAMPA